MTGSSARRADIQGLRALAVVLVVVFHSGLGLTGGFVGVDVFFVISGFVITAMLLRELDGQGHLSFGRFYRRRVQRLLPALGLLLAVVLLLATLLGSLAGQQVTARTGVGAAAFSANAYLARAGGGYFDVGADSNALLHTWSLAVEEQFYLVFPLLVGTSWAVARRRRRSPRRAAGATIAAVSAASLALSWYLTTEAGSLPLIGDRARDVAYYGSPTRAWEFGAGALLACAGPRLPRTGRRGALVLSAGGLALVGWAAVAFDSVTAFPGLAALVPVAGAVLLIAAGRDRDEAGSVQRALSSPIPTWIGDRSYSWYLWHWPCIVFARAWWPDSRLAPILAAVLSLGPAELAYRLVEDPIRRRPALPARRTLGLAAVCTLVPVVAAVGLDVGHRALVSSDRTEAYRAATADHADDARGCNDDLPLGRRHGPRCTWPLPGSTGDAVLVGDSNAGMFTEPFVAAAHAAGYDATVATHYGCPFASVGLVRFGVAEPDCRAFVDGTVDELVRRRPALVVIASATDVYPIRDEITLSGAAGRASSPSTKARALERGLRVVVERLEAADVAVVVVHPIPKFEPWDLAACSALRVLVDEQDCRADRSTARLEGRRAAALAIEERALRGTRARTLDLGATLCPAARCSTYRDGAWWWRNGGHLTVLAAERLTPELTAALAAASTTPR